MAKKDKKGKGKDADNGEEGKKGKKKKGKKSAPAEVYIPYEERLSAIVAADRKKHIELTEEQVLEMIKDKTKKTMILLLFCTIVQIFNTKSLYFTGILVNMALIVATLVVGIESGLFLAIFSPFVSTLFGQIPIFHIIPMMIPTIMFANMNLVLAIDIGKKHMLYVWFVVGCVAKAGSLWALMKFIIMPIFASEIDYKIVEETMSYFSIPQFITAFIAASIVGVIYPMTKAGKINKEERKISLERAAIISEGKAIARERVKNAEKAGGKKGKKGKKGDDGGDDGGKKGKKKKK